MSWLHCLKRERLNGGLKSGLISFFIRSIDECFFLVLGANLIIAIVFLTFHQHSLLSGMIYGPYRGVKPWAAKRFSLLESHMMMLQRRKTPLGMHNEQYIAQTIIPAIDRQGVVVVEDPTISFLRVRANESVWLLDGVGTKEEKLQQVQTILGRTCVPFKLNYGAVSGENYQCKSNPAFILEA